MTRCKPAILGLFLLSGVHAAGAQVITGSLLGTVRDETDAVLPGTSVGIVSPALLGGSATSVTNEKGQYRFPALAPGLYTLTVELSGFRTYIEEGLRVQIGATLERNVTLELAGIAQSVTVTGESPLLDTRDSGRSTHYGNEYLENTPVRRFSMFDLINSAPGMSATRPAGTANLRATRVSAFGSGTNENTYLVDGTDFTGAYGGRAVPWIDTDVIE
ncbi:MAG: carboxypeptidase regulatory-like domain-containing protein, partial [Vicinamibacteria bacterium]